MGVASEWPRRTPLLSPSALPSSFVLSFAPHPLADGSGRGSAEDRRFCLGGDWGGGGSGERPVRPSAEEGPGTRYVAAAGRAGILWGAAGPHFSRLAPDKQPPGPRVISPPWRWPGEVTGFH